MSAETSAEGTGYFVKGQHFAAALTDGLSVVICKGAVGRAGRSVVTHHDTVESSVESFQALTAEWTADGYVAELMPHTISKSLQRHLTKEPLAKLALPLKWTPKVQAFV